MSEYKLKAVQDLRNQGYAVIVWNPTELRGAPPDRVESRSVEIGWDIIDTLATIEECDECGEASCSLHPNNIV